ncbi:MAG: ABC transporter substrate-binding protein [Bacteroidetes bacterium]|nr:ABC transporter substrate-binding protein [Bacteroidota bacterium]
MLFTDQLNNTIELTSFPKRIVSLVPSQSELLWDLGLRTELVGITKFCIHPNELFKTVKRVGGTKTTDIEAIRTLKPDLIIGNKEENEHTQIVELQKEFNVWMSDIYNLNDALEMIRSIGKIVNKAAEAQVLSDTIYQSFSELKVINKRALYLIWKPYMAAGKATFIGDMLQRIGLENVLVDPQGRYPELNMADIKALDPELILLSSEPYPFKENHILEIKEQLTNAQIELVDGELFSWYGSRLKKSVQYFNDLISSIIYK